METPTTTIVVATYDRPGALTATLGSIQHQTHRAWRALIVGDGCDDRTSRAVAGLGDERFEYVNLSRRFGEQSGPNSVGLALADTPFLAIVNHDDLWLADHLARALEILERGERDLFVGRAAFVRDVGTGDEGVETPIAHRRSRRHRRLADVVGGPFNLFEPCSARVLTRALRDAVGPWRPAARLYRSPLEDWLLRAWRAGARASCSREISVVKVSKRGSPGETGPAYGDSGERHARIASALAAHPLDETRRRMTAALDRRRERRRAGGGRRPRRTAEVEQIVLGHPLARRLYRSTGLDLYSACCVLRGRSRGWRPRRSSLLKTGRPLPTPMDLDAMVREARETLGRKGGAHGS